MKKYLTFFFVLVASFLFSQELTADTPAVDPSMLSEILKAVLIAVASMIGFLVRQAIPALNAYLKQIMHFRGASVVADALTQTIAEMGDELQKTLMDGKIDANEKKILLARAREIAEAKLKNLSGFYKADLIGWIDDQLNIALAKILARISV